MKRHPLVYGFAGALCALLASSLVSNANAGPPAARVQWEYSFFDGDDNPATPGFLVKTANRHGSNGWELQPGTWGNVGELYLFRRQK